MRTTFDNSISAFCQAINDYFEYFHFTLYTLIYMVDKILINTPCINKTCQGHLDLLQFKIYEIKSVMLY